MKGVLVTPAEVLAGVGLLSLLDVMSPRKRLRFIRAMDERIAALIGSATKPKIVRVVSEGADMNLTDARVGALAIWELVKEMTPPFI